MSRIRLNQDYRYRIGNRMRVNLEQEKLLKEEIEREEKQ